jgi:hypothetical protein
MEIEILINDVLKNVLGEDCIIYSICKDKPSIFVQEMDFNDTTVTLASFGLNRVPTNLTYDEKPIAVEIIGSVDKTVSCSWDWFLEIVNEIDEFSLPVKPGFIIENPGELMKINNNIKGVIFITPMFWDNLKTIDNDKLVVAWLMPIPLLKNEMKFLEKNGYEALEEYLEDNDVDVFNFLRVK